MPPDPAQRKSSGALIALGAALGAWYGLLEAVSFTVAGLVPGVLSWRAANASPILLVAPVVYCAVFALLGALTAMASVLMRRMTADHVLIFLCSTLGVFFLLTVPGQFLGIWARVILATGVGVAALRVYAHHSFLVQRLARQSAWSLPAVVSLLGVVALLGPRWVERRAVAGLPPADDRSPNVLLLVMDGQRADRLSSYGAQRRTTPRLDQLASEGVLFERAFAPSSWTLPSHGTMFTGQPQVEHRAGTMRRPYLDGRFPTIAEVLADRGYVTGGFVANTYWVGRQTGLARGFVHFQDMFRNAQDAWVRTVVGRLLAYDVLPRFGLRDVPGRQTAEALNASVLRWLERNSDRPFFAFINYLDVHAPFIAPPGFRGRFSDAADRQAPGTGINLGAPSTVEHSAEQVAADLDGYDESLAYLDHAIGALLDSLDQRGQRENTLVLVTSDHGEGFGEHGLGGHGNSLYSNQLLVPLIVHWPTRLARGRREGRPVSLSRIPTTIASAAGIAPSPFPGASLFDSSAVEYPTADVARRFPVAGPWPSSRTSLRAIVSGNWLYIRPDSGEAELYDYVADPAERSNLIRTDAGRTLAAQLEAVLSRSRSGVIPDGGK